MITYWLLFCAALWGVLTPKALVSRQKRWAWLGVGLIYTLVAGLRHEVGGDWFSYESHFQSVASMDLRSAILDTKDPGYYALSWVIARLGGSLYTLNLACAALLVLGIVHFARAQPWPWIALLVAVPYLLIVVGMGYTRQAAAIGCAMLGLVALENGKARGFVFWVLVGAAFHKSAVLLIPIAALASTQNRIWTWFWVGATALIGGWLFVFDSSDALWVNYVESDYSDASQGGPIRVAMNAVPALLMLWLGKRFELGTIARKTWTWMAILALVCVPLVFVSATAVDRVALYFIPLQLFVFSRLPRVANSTRMRTALVLGIVAYYALVQFVWLNFASHSNSWVPYQFIPLR